MIRHLFALIALVASAFALNAQAAVEINRANRADLETVKGIGPGLSGKIIEARKAGEFKHWGDLVERVGGVGPGNAARLSQAGLTVAGTSFDAASMPAAPAKSKKAEKASRADAAGEAPAKAAARSKGDKAPKSGQ